MSEEIAEKIAIALSKLADFLDASLGNIEKEKEDFAKFIEGENEKIRLAFEELKNEKEALDSIRVEAKRLEAESLEAVRLEADRLEAEKGEDSSKATQKEKRVRV